MSEQEESQVRNIYENLRKAHPDSGLAVTQEELQGIVKAIGLPKGHWYKCPKGKNSKQCLWLSPKLNLVYQAKLS